MNSNHQTLYSRYEEETEWSVTQGKDNHMKKENTDCNINDT